jgi:hypothetical protein
MELSQFILIFFSQCEEFHSLAHFSDRLTEFGHIHPFQNNLSARKTGAAPSHDINTVCQQRNFDVWKQWCLFVILTIKDTLSFFNIKLALFLLALFKSHHSKMITRTNMENSSYSRGIYISRMRSIYSALQSSDLKTMSNNVNVLSSRIREYGTEPIKLADKIKLKLQIENVLYDTAWKRQKNKIISLTLMHSFRLVRHEIPNCWSGTWWPATKLY